VRMLGVSAMRSGPAAQPQRLKVIWIRPCSVCWTFNSLLHRRLPCIAGVPVIVAEKWKNRSQWAQHAMEITILDTRQCRSAGRLHGDTAILAISILSVFVRLGLISQTTAIQAWCRKTTRHDVLSGEVLTAVIWTQEVMHFKALARLLHFREECIGRRPLSADWSSRDTAFAVCLQGNSIHRGRTRVGQSHMSKIFVGLSLIGHGQWRWARNSKDRLTAYDLGLQNRELLILRRSIRCLGTHMAQMLHIGNRDLRTREPSIHMASTRRASMCASRRRELKFNAPPGAGLAMTETMADLNHACE